MKNNYFYCYAPKLFHFLLSRGHRYICVGINENTGGKFWLFEKDAEVNRSLSEYRQQ
ncbi:hypothetical protein ABNF65_19360 [Paenibacillus larvae]